LKDIITDRPPVVEILPKVRGPLERVIGKLKTLDGVGDAEKKTIEDIIRLVQKFMQELEHEKAAALFQLISMATNMESVKFHRGKLAIIKTLQRDFAS